MTFSHPVSPFGAPATALPVLNSVVPESDISEALMAALDALDREKMAFMAVSGDMLDVMRPEMERMATELVRKSLHQAWRIRSQAADRVLGADIS